MMWTKKQLERAYINQTRRNYGLQKENKRYREALEVLGDYTPWEELTDDIVDMKDIANKSLEGESNE